MHYAIKENPDEYDFDEFEVLMNSVIEDIIHKVRKRMVYPGIFFIQTYVVPLSLP